MQTKFSKFQSVAQIVFLRRSVPSTHSFIAASCSTRVAKFNVVSPRVLFTIQRWQQFSVCTSVDSTVQKNTECFWTQSTGHSSQRIRLHVIFCCDLYAVFPLVVFFSCKNFFWSSFLVNVSINFFLLLCQEFCGGALFCAQSLYVVIQNSGVFQSSKRDVLSKRCLAKESGVNSIFSHISHGHVVGPSGTGLRMYT